MSLGHKDDVWNGSLDLPLEYVTMTTMLVMFQKETPSFALPLQKCKMVVVS
jgi:hypothetical protein